ncbi:CLUMA_CG015819, isoform A [Clunio marinus]|uniref:CLUMA_CG015819, isoform A n=1 Tax=Clunio marinus TaxID=568069 RepID=A0A1J1IUP0_9DIPT|nr:CLUMA_CG015819, isoform A [Clunio marinus]
MRTKPPAVCLRYSHESQVSVVGLNLIKKQYFTLVAEIK